jgi:hypothetical protein
MSAGIDYELIKRWSRDLDRPLATLIAQSDDTDPFFASRPGRRRRNAEWFAELWHRLEIPDGVHVRRLHYLLCSTAVARPDGAPYANTHGDWALLVSASADARHLDLVPAAAFVDRRAAEPLVYVPRDQDAAPRLSIIGRSPLPLDLEDPPTFSYLPPTRHEMPSLPLADLTGPQTAEPFAVELWAEKSTMNDVLFPLARRHGVTLVTGVGELSITRCLGLVRRVREHRRRTRILYISDHDPSGECMPVSVARKIEHLLRRGGDDLDIQLNPLVLTPQQVEQFSLPRIPLKETDRRRAQFEARHGAGAVELDALEALHAGELRRIVEAAIDRFREPARRLRSEIRRVEATAMRQALEVGHAVRARHAGSIDQLRDEWEAAQTEIATHREAIARTITDAERAVAEHHQAIQARLDEWRDEAIPVWREIAGDIERSMPRVEWPALDLSDCEIEEPLYDSRRDYLVQMDFYKRFQGKSTTRRGGNGKAPP